MRISSKSDWRRQVISIGLALIVATCLLMIGFALFGMIGSPTNGESANLPLVQNASMSINTFKVLVTSPELRAKVYSAFMLPLCVIPGASGHQLSLLANPASKPTIVTFLVPEYADPNALLESHVASFGVFPDGISLARIFAYNSRFFIVRRKPIAGSKQWILQAYNLWDSAQSKDMKVLLPATEDNFPRKALIFGSFVAVVSEVQPDFLLSIYNLAGAKPGESAIEPVFNEYFSVDNKEYFIVSLRADETEESPILQLAFLPHINSGAAPLVILKYKMLGATPKFIDRVEISFAPDDVEVLGLEGSTYVDLLQGASEEYAKRYKPGNAGWLHPSFVADIGDFVWIGGPDFIIAYNKTAKTPRLLTGSELFGAHIYERDSRLLTKLQYGWSEDFIYVLACDVGVVKNHRLNGINVLKGFDNERKSPMGDSADEDNYIYVARIAANDH